ncbi:MAG: DUF945 domain-containing protein [Verrucomicrobiae bacterium]|nr:DUF945 domain-containing protein [Verrucomicrobiae bacterium]
MIESAADWFQEDMNMQTMTNQHEGTGWSAFSERGGRRDGRVGAQRSMGEGGVVERAMRWQGAPVRLHHGTLAEARRYVPAFERRTFAITQPGNDRSRLNERLDTIVRRPFGEDASFVPVGVVSKDYTLVPHEAVINAAAGALAMAGISAAEALADLRITEYGERMALSIRLPKEYEFDPGDGHPMAFRLECWNSVDGSMRFRALTSWLRLVCSNGLVKRVAGSELRRRHIGTFSRDYVREVLVSGLREAENDKRSFVGWRGRRVTLEAVKPWVEREVWEAWGFKAATRAYHIARCGHDVELLGPFKGQRPTTIPVRETRRVPGMWGECRNLFDLSQVLAWLAKERREVQEQLEWREQIPALLEALN